MQKKQSSDNSVQAFGKLFSDTNEKKNKLFLQPSVKRYIHCKHLVYIQSIQRQIAEYDIKSKYYEEYSKVKRGKLQ